MHVDITKRSYIVPTNVHNRTEWDGNYTLLTCLIFQTSMGLPAHGPASPTQQEGKQTNLGPGSGVTNGLWVE